MKKRRGFTLIELLIVLLVLGVLSGVTIFSTLDLASTADANKIINDMIQLRTATLIWFKENSSRVVLDTKETKYKVETNGSLVYPSKFVETNGSEILKYISNKYNSNGNPMTLHYKGSPGDTGDYGLIAVSNGKKWYICCNLGTPDLLKKGEEAPDAKVREKIAGKANSKDLPLYGTNDLGSDAVPGTYTGQKFVCIPVLELGK